jgi:hypothetical protein
MPVLGYCQCYHFYAMVLIMVVVGRSVKTGGKKWCGAVGCA